MFETFPWFQGEGFNMIIADLLRLPHAPSVVVEGLRLLPRHVSPLLVEPAHAVWLMPSGSCRLAPAVWLLPSGSCRLAPADARLPSGRGRESGGDRPRGFSPGQTDPERALRNLLERDRMFTDVLREETARPDLPTIEVDGTMTEDDLATRVTELFGL